MKKDLTKGNDSTVTVHLREACLIILLFAVQATVMSSVIYKLGYNKSPEEILSTLVLELPAWFVYGALLPAIIGVGALAFVVRKYFSE